jgi:hypothetical protein
MTDIGSSLIALPITAVMLLGLLVWATLIARRNKNAAGDHDSQYDAGLPSEADTAEQREHAEHF